eukprot:jgi/Chrzof1/12422/Cz06g34040.t1
MHRPAATAATAATTACHQSGQTAQQSAGTAGIAQQTAAPVARADMSEQKQCLLQRLQGSSNPWVLGPVMPEQQQLLTHHIHQTNSLSMLCPHEPRTFTAPVSAAAAVSAGVIAGKSQGSCCGSTASVAAATTASGLPLLMLAACLPTCSMGNADKDCDDELSFNVPSSAPKDLDDGDLSLEVPTAGGQPGDEHAAAAAAGGGETSGWCWWIELWNDNTWITSLIYVALCYMPALDSSQQQVRRFAMFSFRNWTWRPVEQV